MDTGIGEKGYITHLAETSYAWNNKSPQSKNASE